MLSEKLKTETAFNHQQLEKKLVAKMRAMHSQDDYASLLQLFYSYFGGLETLIDAYIDKSRLPDYAQRRKASQLASDLVALGTKIPLASGIEYLPQINDGAKALGALYVMEGSTLGGQIIKKMISKQLGIEDVNVLSFFNSYGEHTIEMWNTFKNALNHTDLKETEASIIGSANETFQKFGEWFDIYYRH